MELDNTIVDQLQARIRELEEKVEALRISRRVLMNLIDNLEQDRRDQLLRLEIKNERLLRNNCKYARALMNRNLKISQLETKIRMLVSQNETNPGTFT